MKNPEHKPLKIVHDEGIWPGTNNFVTALGQLAVANAILWSKGKESGKTHYLAIVKELERLCGFHFELLEEPNRPEVRQVPMEEALQDLSARVQNDPKFAERLTNLSGSDEAIPKQDTADTSQEVTSGAADAPGGAVGLSVGGLPMCCGDAVILRMSDRNKAYCPDCGRYYNKMGQTWGRPEDPPYDSDEDAKRYLDEGGDPD